MKFNLPKENTARYLAIDVPDGGRHHIELYSPHLLHPTKQNVTIWAAYDLREVRFFLLEVVCCWRFLRTVLGVRHYAGVHSPIFSASSQKPSALYDFTAGIISMSVLV